jgi:pyrimidine deaminase RibD-like protein
MIRDMNARDDETTKLVKRPRKRKMVDRAALQDRKFARLAIEEARKSISENDGRPHGRVLAACHRGQIEGNHAEYFALEKKLGDTSIVGATVYTTLEPCTTRTHPKVPCVERLIERKVARVVIGMLDPNPKITGRGQQKLRKANIVTDLFPHELMSEVEELNREFSRAFDLTPGIPESTRPMLEFRSASGSLPKEPLKNSPIHRLSG